MATRTEHDSIGDLEVDDSLLYGVQTQRALNNFHITGEKTSPVFIKALALFKKAAAMTNMEAKRLSKDRADLIIKAADEIISGLHHEAFVTDPIQGGAGTSMNMNMNEVICNRAAELANKSKGKYDFIHPNDHVNMSQSTNDVIPTSAKIAAIYAIEDLKLAIKHLSETLNNKSVELKDVIKIGRTHLQDAVPITMGQELKAWSNSLQRDLNRLDFIKLEFMGVNAGGTAVGTGITSDEYYFNNIARNLAKVTGIEGMHQAVDTIDATRHLDSFVMLSGIFKALAVNLSKNCNDLRLMASGPLAGLKEINLQSWQPGSSIMPGKINPVIPEVVNQCCFEVFGNDLTITKAAEAGQFELNVFEPVLIRQMLESFKILTNVVNTLADKAIATMTANAERCKDVLQHSLGLVTALSPFVGYEKAAFVAKQIIKTGKSMEEIVLANKIMSKFAFDQVTHPEAMLKPGIIKLKPESK